MVRRAGWRRRARFPRASRRPRTTFACRPRRARFSRNRFSRGNERSTAVTCAPAVASCAVLPPGAAQRSVTVLPLHIAEQPGGHCGSGVLHPPVAAVEARQLRHRSVRRSGARVPVGSTRPSSLAAHCCGSLFTVRSSAGSRAFAAAIVARHRLRRNATASASSASPACRARWDRWCRAGSCPRGAHLRSTALTRRGIVPGHAVFLREPHRKVDRRVVWARRETMICAAPISSALSIRGCTVREGRDRGSR